MVVTVVGAWARKAIPSCTVVELCSRERPASSWPLPNVVAAHGEAELDVVIVAGPWARALPAVEGEASSEVHAQVVEWLWGPVRNFVTQDPRDAELPWRVDHNFTVKIPQDTRQVGRIDVLQRVVVVVLGPVDVESQKRCSAGLLQRRVSRPVRICLEDGELILHGARAFQCTLAFGGRASYHTCVPAECWEEGHFLTLSSVACSVLIAAARISSPTKALAAARLSPAGTQAVFGEVVDVLGGAGSPHTLPIVHHAAPTHSQHQPRRILRSASNPKLQGAQGTPSTLVSWKALVIGVQRETHVGRLLFHPLVSPHP
mmetsp:Transcript_26397/g.42302  ORF Transcript_26397/g.42302 Transcript_26397/m.42302 type:complete len:316 (-) Transcript_26397:71-1018(-)